MTAPQILPWQDVQKRLRRIFPEGTPHHKDSTWDVAAKTVFVMLYLDAVEGTDNWLRPDQVTRMTDTQAAMADQSARKEWAKASMARSKSDLPGRWYAVNTRESIRDDTIRNAFIENGAVIERTGLATTSSLGKYALQKAFSHLFAPGLSESEADALILAWQEKYLTAGARMRIAVVRKGASTGTDRILVKFPNGETRLMAPGPSSELSKQVVEIFAPLFLQSPEVIFLSESRDKVVARDEDLAKRIGLNILADKNLPDIILADLGPEDPLLVFIEVVASDGPVSEARKKALLALTEAAGFPASNIRFVTAYFDRSAPQFKKTVDRLAWGSFAWFAAEPDGLIEMYDGSATALSAFRSI